MRRKGELSTTAIDHGWPHQVALPEDAVRSASYHPTHDRQAFPSLCVRGHTFMRDSRCYVVLCFADPGIAARLESASSPTGLSAPPRRRR